MRRNFLVVVVLALTGRPYPIHKLIQPESVAQVVNRTGAPLEGANVTLCSRAYPYGFEKSRDTKRTDARFGQAISCEHSER